MSILGFLGKVGKAVASNLPIVGGIVSNAMNTKSQEKINQKNIDYAREAYARERADALSDWHMQNAYNDPAAQMERLKNAGLNPNLVYGSGADAQMGAPVRASKQQLPDLKAPDYGSIVSNALGAMQARANIRRTEAETKSIEAQTFGHSFKNEILKSVGVQQYANDERWKQEMNEIKSSRLNAEWETYLATGYQGKAFNDPSSPVSKALKAGFDKARIEYDNAVKLGNLRAAETAIKQFSVGLVKRGINPSDPWHARMIQSIFGVSPDDVNLILNPNYD